MKMTITRAGFTAAILLFSSLGIAQQVQNDGYVRDSAGAVEMNPFGLCWRTSQWTEAKAIAECDPDLMPKPAPRRAEAPAPAPAPALVPAPVPTPPPAPIVAAPVAAPAAAPAPAPRRTESITLGADAAFDTGKADLKPEGQAKLESLAIRLKEIRFDAIQVTGHTDSVGGDVPNQRLSLRRAEAVKQYLASHGVDPKKIRTAGRGKATPVADNKTAQGRARNRRVEVEIKGTRTL
jgi:OOP family OmpA-OmpF porin